MINKYGDTPKTPFSNTFGKELVNKAKMLNIYQINVSVENYVEKDY
jgi:hypothetical protein